MATPIKLFKGSESKLSSLDIKDGQLIFTIDNKNIYLDLITNGETDKTTEEVIDKLFLPSYPEIFGNTSYGNYLNGATPVGEEGTQWDYYKTSSNKVKKGNNNGSANSTSCYWWMGSASSRNNSTGYSWCYVYTDGTADYGYGYRALGARSGFLLIIKTLVDIDTLRFLFFVQNKIATN